MIRTLFLIVFLFICGVTFYYVDPMKMFTLADEKLTDFLNADFDLEQKDENKLDHGEPKNSILNEENNAEKNEPNTDQKETQSVSSIVTKYEDSLTSLKEQVEEKLNVLMEHAFEEYAADKQDDGNVNLPMLYLKYKKAIDDLEEKTDSSFQKIYEQLKEELSSHGYDPSEASSIKEEFEQMKEQTKSVMMEKVMDKFEV
ncbi:DnaJ-domain-containing protein 1 [Salirhabdus euzebyi]|uniref:DnaJ-domain-containing protein 1 n=1 Tax=Salirhabdus euzebyi TaxID=394506 RepID=A0A841Q5L1_9BACI|nr:hypothetical protein [Salirhabdus euzebyi]MBB6453643.1 DnaJ-domain-containing protein 1 [Salirhabdus euzebyi]